jgi:hypothetical protein
MSLIMRPDVREYLRASAKLFGLAYQENALTEAEREAIVSYAQEVAKRFDYAANKEATHFPLSNSIVTDEAAVLVALRQNPES